MNKKMNFCQSCGMPLTEDVLGTNADGSKNEDYCMYCYRDGHFLQDYTMDEMIEYCAQFVNAVNEGLEKPITKEEYIGMMKSYFPQLKRWRQTLDVSNDEVTNVNPALAGIKELIAQMADKQPIAYISSVDQEGFPWTKAMLKPRKREGIKTFYFTTNTFSIRVARDNNLEILRLCKQYEVPTILGSDAHISFQIADYERLYPLLAETDFPDELIMNYQPDRFFEYLGIQK